jgi:hypothetical protein
MPRIDVRWQDRKALAFTGSEARQLARRDPEEVHADQRRELEHNADGYRRYATLRVAHRDLGNASTLAEFSLRPPAQSAPLSDPQSEYASSVQRLLGERMRTTHGPAFSGSSITILS